MYDVVIAGGSISGLLCAKEIASKGYKVLVLEKNFEIGTPDHCGGLVSESALLDLDILHTRNIIQSAQIISPDGTTLEINSKQKIFELDRRELDKKIALYAQQSGAEIKVNCTVLEFTADGVKTSDGFKKCKVIVDARGVSSLIHKDKKGIISCAQYEVYADWIKNGTIKVFFDSVKYPGFFAWVIPSSDGAGKIGVAGRDINVSKALDDLISQQGKCSIVRKIFAPIWIKGPIKNFVDDNIVTIGDAAGLSKPTTAGGIFSCGMSGIFAGKSISQFLETSNYTSLLQYQKMWQEKFGSEFQKQLLARKILERLDNDTINKLVNLASQKLASELSETNFDFHALSILKLVGLGSSFKIIQSVFASEIKKLSSKV